MIRSSLTLLLALIFCTCAPSPKTEASEAVTADTAGNLTYPSIDLDRLVYLWENATYMDATFYTLPISINQSEPDQIKQTIATIGEDPIMLPTTCKAAGHIWFQVNGVNVEEADIYFSPGCVGYVWYEEGKPAYSNQMTEVGANFYNNIINSVQQQQQQ
ncbi:hypothetical protein [Neolewinella persica]|uniref:hypothetical protein n=1 Tax=Neolewinella persica TaxID=70998 RepID=UPI0003797A45|nr:hypothetical protein [Neolewinella persica]